MVVRVDVHGESDDGPFDLGQWDVADSEIAEVDHFLFAGFVPLPVARCITACMASMREPFDLGGDLAGLVRMPLSGFLALLGDSASEVLQRRASTPPRTPLPPPPLNGQFLTLATAACAGLPVNRVISPAFRMARSQSLRSAVKETSID